MILSGIKNKGVAGSVVYLLERKLNLRLPISKKARWKAAIQSEVDFWNRYFKTGGLEWRADYLNRLDPGTELQEDVKAYLPEHTNVCILDVGAGPLTILNKNINGNKLSITAVDPLGDEYDRIQKKYNVQPLIRTQKLDAENLRSKFSENSFDLVFARNCIDHSYSPELAILEMLAVVKPNRYVYMKHSNNEAIKENWEGLHQWNFTQKNGDFIISSRTSELNFSKKYAHLCETKCVLDEETDWINVSIKKHATN